MASPASTPVPTDVGLVSTPNMVRAKSASVSPTEYEEPKTVSRFADVCNSIRSKTEEQLGFNAVDVTQRGLSLLTGQLRLFMETSLGINSPPSRRPISKVPHRLFSDYTPDGALEVMLSTCLRFKSSSGLRRLDFQNSDRNSLYLDMLRLVEKNLARAGLLPEVKVYISSKVPTNMLAELRGIVHRRASLVTSPSNATHIIYPDPKGTTPAETDGTDYCRTIQVAGPHALVHWWYHPDSYDSWIPRADVQGDPEPEADIQGPWHVQVRWLRDTDLFNEWMNELDYEIQEDLRDKLSSDEPSPREKKKKGEKSSIQFPGRKLSRKRKRFDSTSQKLDVDHPDDYAEHVRDVNCSSDSRSARRKVEDPSESTDEIAMNEFDSTSNLEDSGVGEREKSKFRGGPKEMIMEKDERSLDRGKENSRGSGRERRDKSLDRGREKSRSRDVDRARDRRDRDRQKLRNRRLEQNGLDGTRPDSDDIADLGGVSGSDRRAQRHQTDEDEGLVAASDDFASPELQDDQDELDEPKPSKRAKIFLDDRSGSGSESPFRAPRFNTRNKSHGLKDQSQLSSSSSDEEVQGPVQGLKVRVKISVPPKETASANNATEIADSVKADTANMEPDEKEARGIRDNLESSASGAAVNINATDAVDSVEKGARKSKSRKRDRRGGQPRNVGVSAVEDADPIPESEIQRIRNISMDVPDKIALGADRTRLREIHDSGEIKSDPPEERMDATRGRSGFNDTNSHRATAVPLHGLVGRASGAPVSVADLADSLPAAPIRVPAQSRWFRSDCIHDLEKRSLPEFFSCRSPSKTPKVYKLYRDFMIDSWRQSPTKYLTATSVRRHLAGDVCAILRVHAFLEHWGLINFGVKPETRPHHASMKGIRSESWNAEPISDQPSHSGSFNDSSTGGVPRLLLFDEPPSSHKHVSGTTLNSAVGAARGSTKQEISLASRREVYAAAAALKYKCDACDKDCSRMRYHCVGQADIDLCPSCFADGRYPTSLSARDFEQLTTVSSSEAYDGSVWSEAEVLLLLEGLEQYGDDWNAVANHVGTKSNEQCVLQFLRMPIEDSFLGDQIGKWGISAGEKGAADLAASGEHVFASSPAPFADTSNPVMAQIAFLASSVSPEVAAAAAQAALTQIMSETNSLARPSASVKAERKELATTLVHNASQRSNVKDNSRPSKSSSPPTVVQRVTTGISADQVGGSTKTIPLDAEFGGRATSNGTLPSSGDVEIRCGAEAESTSPVNNSVCKAGFATDKKAQPSSQGKPSLSNLPCNELDAAAVQASAAVGLAAAAARARKLADAEVREIERVFALVVETKLRVIDEKMQSFAKLESFTRSERDRLERERQVLYAERVSTALARAGGKDDSLRVSMPTNNFAAPPSVPAQFPTNTMSSAP